MKIAINGFGRIGKTFLRVLLADKQLRDRIEVVAINIGPATKSLVGQLFKYDTIMGTLGSSVEQKDDYLVVDGYAMQLLAEIDPAALPWKSLGIDWVVECSGRFSTREGATKHLEAGAKRVLVSAPCAGDDATIILGVNDQALREQDRIVSLGSCTTNALLPLLKVLYDDCGLQKGFMTTVHAYTNTQALLDVDVHDARRSRAAALNIVPTTSGATSTVEKVMPMLAGKFDGCALRVPVAKVSIVDITFESSKQLNAEMINSALVQAANSRMKTIIEVTSLPLVSSDFSGNPHSVIVDASLTQALGSLGKVFGWYDNEWGYCSRLKDFLRARI